MIDLNFDSEMHIIQLFQQESYDDTYLNDAIRSGICYENKGLTRMD